MRILAVDDDPDTLRALRLLLAQRGHQVTTARTLAGGRAHCEAGGFDLLLCDLGLPDGDGRELAGLARRHGLRAVAVSGYDPVGSADEPLDGFWAYLVKPVSFDRVNELIERAAGERAIRPAAAQG